MDTFETKVSGLTGNADLLAGAAGLQRDFIVLIRQTQYDVALGKFQTKYENINVLIGT